MKKYMVCLLFAVFLMLTILPRNAVSAESVISGTLEENLTWEFRDGTLTISGNGYMGSYSISENPPWFHLREGIHTIVVSEGGYESWRLGIQRTFQCDEGYIAFHTQVYFCKSVSGLFQFG